MIRHHGLNPTNPCLLLLRLLVSGVMAGRQVSALRSALQNVLEYTRSWSLGALQKCTPSLQRTPEDSNALHMIRR